MVESLNSSQDESFGESYIASSFIFLFFQIIIYMCINNYFQKSNNFWKIDIFEKKILFLFYAQQSSFNKIKVFKSRISLVFYFKNNFKNSAFFVFLR